jgi:hypothetical protein
VAGHDQHHRLHAHGEDGELERVHAECTC